MASAVGYSAGWNMLFTCRHLLTMDQYRHTFLSSCFAYRLFHSVIVVSLALNGRSHLLTGTVQICY